MRTLAFSDLHNILKVAIKYQARYLNLRAGASAEILYQGQPRTIDLEKTPDSEYVREVLKATLSPEEAAAFDSGRDVTGEILVTSGLSIMVRAYRYRGALSLRADFHAIPANVAGVSAVGRPLTY
ncbi:MAG: hypothetical protein NUW37_17070 [Planctomycetes bacterium]|nr:hypothetical protein [Planctomycetota bacterium]